MNTRRKFLLHGSLASTALLLTKPFKSIARPFATVTGFSVNDTKVVLVHAGNACNSYHQTVIKISDLKKSTGNMVSVFAGNLNDSNQNFDAVINQKNEFHFSEKDYKVVYKGDYKIGIITAVEGVNSAENINALSAYLKKERYCNLVVCLSQLGHKNSVFNDHSLANKSSHLDIIIGGHASDFCQHTMVALNKNNEEVIIDHAASKTFGLGKIEIDFDSYGKKRKVCFSNA